MSIYVPIDRNSKKPLTKQIYLFIKEKVLGGELPAGQKLPSTRELSKELAVSRNVVLNAYAQLLAEGYLYSKDRCGLFVVEGINISKKAVRKAREKKEIIGLQFEENKNIIDFRTGVPSLELFPKNLWGKIYRHVCMDAESTNLDYYEPGGSYELRCRLSEYLERVRGVNCDAENIIITSGAAQSFSILVKYFSGIDNSAVVEDPISCGITKILNFFDMKIHPVPLDERGIITGLLSPGTSPGLIFTTPSHQFPTGAVLPMSRRAKLIEYAKKEEAYIVEDDYDSEFRFEGYPIQSMQSLAPERIIYVGTFSKTLCPALRIGYMILPEKLTRVIKSIKYIDDLHSPVLEQITLARFIEEGFLDRHVVKSRKHYAEKCAHLVLNLKDLFENDIKIYGQTAGIHIMVQFKNFVFTDKFIEKLRKNGVNINTAEEHAVKKGRYKSHILLGFGNLEKEKITEGLMILKNAMADFRG